MITPRLWPWLWRFLVDYSALLVCLGLGAGAAWPLWLTCALVIGTRQHALGVLGHDALHGLAAPRYNTALTALCCWPLGMSTSGYRAFHMAHHWWTNRPGDPEWQFYRNPLVAWQWRWPPTWWRVTLGLLWDLVFGWVEWGSMVLGLITTGGDLEGAIVGVLHLWLLVALWVVHPPMLVLWYASLWTSAQMCFRLRALTEHQEADVVTSHLEWPAWWQRWLYLPHNTWCHDAHHDAVARHAQVPCWALPQYWGP